MATDWLTPYRAALAERDPAKVAAACEKARLAIFERTTELVGHKPGSPPMEELDAALRQLVIHEHHIKGRD